MNSQTKIIFIQLPHQKMQNSSINISLLASVFLLIIFTFNAVNSVPSPSADADAFLAHFGQQSNESCAACVEEYKQMDVYSTRFVSQFNAWFAGEICPQIVGQEKECLRELDFLRNKTWTIHDELERDPKRFCRRLGVCGWWTSGRNDVATKLSKMFEQQKENMLKKFDGSNFGKFAQRDEKPSCQACLDYYKQMDAYVTKFGPLVVEYVGTKICPKLPEYEASCKIWSKKYLEWVIQSAHELFAQAFLICKKMDLC